jgi:predicted DNA-binding helix-hairpin-helix protein
MDATFEQLKALTAQMHLEPAEDALCPQIPAKREDEIYVGHATLPNGKTIKLLKTLLTSACERNCNYCPFRAGRDFRRATFKPEEFAQVFMSLHLKAPDGLFISSGIANGGMLTQDKLIDTADILRHKYQYEGYLHLKIMPGAERAQVERAMQLADRVSINLEAPNTERLQLLAPRKQFIEELLEPLRWVDDIRRNQPDRLGYRGYWPSSVTQFVVGAVGENDLELLHTTDYLYRKLHLRRACYSFQPHPRYAARNQPKVSQAGAPPLRPPSPAGLWLQPGGAAFERWSLPWMTDPKLAWARTCLSRPCRAQSRFRSQLLRVPGIGPKEPISSSPVAGRTSSAPGRPAQDRPQPSRSPPSSFWTVKTPYQLPLL